MARIEWKVWNIHKEWQSLRATTMDEAARELQDKMPYSEEAQIRVDGKDVYKFHPKRDNINFGPW